MTNSKTFTLFSLLLFATTSFIGCNNPRKEIQRIVQEWQGKEVLFPENIVFTYTAGICVD